MTNGSTYHHGSLSRPDQPPQRRLESVGRSRQPRCSERYPHPLSSTHLPAHQQYKRFTSPIHTIPSQSISSPTPTTNPTTVTIRLQPIGSAPHLTQRIFKLSTNQTFATIVRFLRKRLGVKEHESVFCYVGNVFSPALDEGVGNLWSCFRQGEELVVGYALAPAFG